MTYDYTLTLIKGGEVTVEHLIGPELYEDEIDESGYDISGARFYLVGPDGEEMDIDTEFDDDAECETETLDNEQYVKYVCWRTSDWTVTSDVPLTAADVIPRYRDFGGYKFLDFEIPKATEVEFDSSWDGKYQDIVVEASNPTFSMPEDAF
jgi:hypothetical protein